MEHAGKISNGKTGLPFRKFHLFSGTFPWNAWKTWVPLTSQPEFPEGKRPWTPLRLEWTGVDIQERRLGSSSPDPLRQDSVRCVQTACSSSVPLVFILCYAGKFFVSARKPYQIGPPLFLDKLRSEGPKKFFLETAPPPYLRIWMTAPPPLSQGLDPALVVGGMLFLPPWFFRYKGVGYTRAESHCTLFLTLCSFLREAVARNGIWYIDCEQSLLFFRFGKGSARARERWAAKLRDARRETRDARNEGGSLSRLRSFSHARGHLRVSGVLLDEPRKKRDCS